jgi:hypothetical protein
MVVRPFSDCDEGTRENNHQIIFLSVTKEHEKRVIRPSLKCHSGGGEESRRFFLNLLQFPLPYGTANNPENVSKK